MTEEVAGFVIARAEGILKEWGGCLIEAKADMDHVHMLITIPPKYDLSTCIGSLKQATARSVQKEYQYLRTLPENGRLWSSSFYISTVGDTDMETVKRYIDLQGETRKRGRPTERETVIPRRKGSDHRALPSPP